MLENLTRLYCDIDDFISSIRKAENIRQIKSKKRSKSRPRFVLSEILTILVAYHSSDF